MQPQGVITHKLRTTALKEYNKVQNLTTQIPEYTASRSKLTGIQKVWLNQEWKRYMAQVLAQW